MFEELIGKKVVAVMVSGNPEKGILKSAKNGWIVIYDVKHGKDVTINTEFISVLRETV